MMDPFGFWEIGRTAEERREYAQAVEEATKEWQKLLVLPLCAFIVLSAAMVR